MTTYKVDFSYSVPEWSDVTFEAPSEEVAKKEAFGIISDLYPEAIDIEIDSVTEATETADAS